MLLVCRGICEYALANAYYFSRGESLNAYEFLGSHRVSEEGERFLYSFAFYEKDAIWVELVGDFNDRHGIRMTRIGESGIWYALYESRICIDGSPYAYRIKCKSGGIFTRYDPFSEVSPCGERSFSTVRTENKFEWSDKKYMSCRKSAFGAAIENASVFNAEVRDGENYRELWDRLSLRCAKLGYTHVVIHGAREKLFGDAFFGCFTPSLRYGSSDDFSYLVNKLHSVNVGVVIEMLPAGVSFPKDAWSLPENRSLLMSSAMFWYRNYHIDGLFADACNLPLCMTVLSELKKRTDSDLFDFFAVSDGKIQY